MISNKKVPLWISIELRVIIFYICLFLVNETVGVPSIHITDGDDIALAYPWEILREQMLLKCTFKADVCCLSNEECEYLTGWKAGQLLTGAKLRDGIALLMAKKKIKSIACIIEESSKGCTLTCHLESYWTFERIIIHGILFGKEPYAQAYGMVYGDVFDKQKHKHGLSALKSLLKKSGYYKASLSTSYRYNYRTKMVTVIAQIDKGQKFRVGSVTLQVLGGEVLDCDMKFLRYSLEQKYLKRLQGRTYDQRYIAKVTKDMVNYASRRGYICNTIEKKERYDSQEHTVSLSFTMTIGENRQFIFVGNKELSYTDLFNCLRDMGRVAWYVPATMICNDLLHYYHKKGFFNAKVTVQEQKHKAIFFIHEGKRFSLNAVAITGVGFIKDDLEKKFFKKTVRSRFFDDDVFQKELGELQDFYVRNGFLDASIVSYQFNQNNDKGFSGRIVVTEGNQYIIDDVTISGDLEQSFVFQREYKGNFCTDIVIAQQREELTRTMEGLNCESYSLSPDITKTSLGHVAIVWIIRVKKQKTVLPRVVLQGCPDVPFNGLLSEVLDVYQHYHKAPLKQLFERMRALDIFEMIHASNRQLSGLEDMNVMLLRLDHDTAYEARLRMGFELENVSYSRLFGQGLGYKVGGSLIARNPLKQSDILRCNVDLARFHYEVDCQYKHPWFMNKPIRSLFKIYAIRNEQPAFVGFRHSLYTAYQRGFLVSLNRYYGMLDATLNLGVDWEKTDIHADNEKDRRVFLSIAHAINFKPDLDGIFVPYVVVEPIVYFDYLDDKINPHKGMLTMATVRALFALQARPHSSYAIKCLIEQSFFWPVASAVGALRVRFGHIFHKDFSTLMPIQRFYLGGVQSLRGYETDLAPPLGICHDDNSGCLMIVPRGAKSMVNINAEVRMQPMKNIGIVFFQDFGTLADDIKAHFNSKKLLATTGFGFRYQTPIGPLRFDIGWKWFNDKISHQSYQWYLTIGNAF